jgi:hypothetical protein
LGERIDDLPRLAVLAQMTTTWGPGMISCEGALSRSCCLRSVGEELVSLVVVLVL